MAKQVREQESPLLAARNGGLGGVSVDVSKTEALKMILQKRASFFSGI